MMDIYPPTVQRPELLKFAEALGSRENALRRDECGDWRINGDDGHIYAVPSGFQIFVIGCETVRQWTFVKSAMKSFADLTNDGDMEGAFFLDHFPTSVEAETIRQYVRVSKKRVVGEEELARLRAHAVENAFQPKLKPSRDSED